jgi:uncharacterized protein YjbI with pentapeptide repeats
VKKRNEKKHWRNMFLERFLNVKDWAKKTTQYLLRRTYQNKFLPFKAWANKRILPRIKKGTKGFLNFVKENLWKIIFWILGILLLVSILYLLYFKVVLVAVCIIIFLISIIAFRIIWIYFLKKEEKIGMNDFFGLIVKTISAVIITVGLYLTSEQIKNQTSELELKRNEQYNQQFLDAINLFKNENSFEVRKGALYHLENLALSSPTHRQRVLDFLNSLNSWMRENADKIKDADFTAWKNEKNLLIDEKIVPKETQLLSAEIPKIFENIIRKHNEEYKSFSEEEKKRFALDFSYFVFAEIHFVRFNFPQTETSFRNCIFLGYTNFSLAKFSGGNANFEGAKFSGGDASFYGAKFSGGNAYFSEAEFSGGDAIFHEAKFSGGNAYFSGAKFFGGRADFRGAQFFGGRADFRGAQFSGGNAIFSEAKFSGGNANFFGAKFSGGDADFSEAKFSGGNANFFGAKFSGGNADFYGAQFSGGNADFYGAEFSGGYANFWEAKFSGGYASFSGAKFSGGDAIFSGAKFSGGRASFSGAEFSGGDAIFHEAKFSGGNAYFSEAEFSGGDAIFHEAKFSKTISAEKADFTKCPIKIKDIWGDEEFDFLSPENYKKFRDGGAIFSDEQKKYFEKKLKSASL